MNIALIIAGGTGERMGGTIPKQFIEVNGKPILSYTIGKFQKHKLIDRIAIVCIQGWESYVMDFVSRFQFSKVDTVVKGGNTALESIRNGFQFEIGQRYAGPHLYRIAVGCHARPLP